MKKQILSVFLVLMFILAGCGGDKPVVSKPTTPDYTDSSNSNSDIAESENDDESKKETSSNNSSKVDTYEISGGDSIFEDLMEVEEESDGGFEIIVEKDKERNTLNTAWREFNNCPATSVIEEQAQKMREAVLNTGNTKDYYSWRGRTFYVSPDGDDANDGLTPETAIKTLDADVIRISPPKSGDAVLFERGGIWRLSSKISAKEGVIYGSYGEGPKPAFYGSPYNYADTTFWTSSNKQNVWKVSIATTDIGSITFNEGELMGDKKLNGITVLEKNGDFYFNSNADTLYLYCKDGNPGKVYKDIELGALSDCFGVSRDDVVIDNICAKYFSGFAVAMCDNDNTKITNCEFGFIGGRIQSGTTRLGNCVQQWNSTDTQLIHNNWMYQAYDTGYTWQGSDTYEVGFDPEGNLRKGDKVYYKDITVTNNIIEYCNYAIETWHNTHEDLIDNDYTVLAKITNFKLNDNIFRYSGYGWGGIQRPNKWGYAHYGGSSSEFPNAVNCEIKNNVYDMALRQLIRWQQRDMSYMGEDHWTISGNSFYQTGNKYGESIQLDRALGASSQSGLEAACSYFDKNYKEILWLEND